MRIDTTLLPQAIGFLTPSAQSGRTSSFDTLLSPADSDSGEPEAKAVPGASHDAFSFDALSVLGLGGPVGVGRTGKVDGDKDGVNTPAAPGPQAPVPHAPQASALAVHPVTVAPAAADVSAPSAEGSPGPVAMAADTAAAVAPVQHAPPVALPGAAMPAGAPVAASGALSGPANAGELAAEVSSAPVPVTTVARAAGPDARAFAAEGPDEPAAPRKASSAFEAQTEADTSSGQISLTLSESDGVLNVVASAPGLTEGDRQSLERAADEVAGETGAPLGALRLNGVTIRPFSKVS